MTEKGSPNTHRSSAGTGECHMLGVGPRAENLIEREVAICFENRAKRHKTGAVYAKHMHYELLELPRLVSWQW